MRLAVHISLANEALSALATAWAQASPSEVAIVDALRATAQSLQAAPGPVEAALDLLDRVAPDSPTAAIAARVAVARVLVVALAPRPTR